MRPIGHVEPCDCVSTMGPSSHVGSFGRVVPFCYVGPVGRVGPFGRVGPSDLSSYLGSS